MTDPYYQDDHCTIYHGDCRYILPTIDAQVVVTDPPYGVGIDDTFDDTFQSAFMLDQSPGVRMAAFMSPRRVVEFAAGLKSWSFERLLWMAKQGDIAHPWRGWHMNGETIVVASRSRVDWPSPETTRTDCYTPSFAGRTGHPANKPLSVVRDLVARLSASSNLVLDPFMGGGTTLRAAKDLGRKAIGIEIEERYCEIAATRLGQEVLAFAD